MSNFWVSSIFWDPGRACEIPGIPTRRPLIFGRFFGTKHGSRWSWKQHVRHANGALIGILTMVYDLLIEFMDSKHSTKEVAILKSYNVSLNLLLKKKLVGGFKYFLCSTLPGEMIQFDEHIFQMGSKPPTRKSFWLHWCLSSWCTGCPQIKFCVQEDGRIQK